MSPQIQISEIFGPTVQGEGALIGQPTVFVRTGGCDYRCSWCDTMHAVDPANSKDWQKMKVGDILDQVDRLSNGKVKMVTISGGNPALQSLDDLLDQGHVRGYQFALETQGSVAKDWFSKLDVLNLSPKGPSSGETTEIQAVQTCLDLSAPETQASLKIVIFDDADYLYAKTMNEAFPHLKIYLQVGNPFVDETQPVDMDELLKRQVNLSEKVLKDDWMNVAILPQMHVLMWGNKRGV